MVDAADTFFSFTVVEGMQPGDVLRARTPTGCLLELTVPKGALVGDIVQFALPDPNEEPHVVPTPRGNTQPAVPAKFKATARVNVRDVDEHGLTNAKPKGIFCVKLPSRITGGESIVVDLPHGERVTVTVPPRAKAGRELKFCAGVGGEPASIVDVRIKYVQRANIPRGPHLCAQAHISPALRRTPRSRTRTPRRPAHLARRRSAFLAQACASRAFLPAARPPPSPWLARVHFFLISG